MPTPLPYQLSAVTAALASPGRRWIFADPTGLGKTAEALLALSTFNPPRVVVVTTKEGRRSWMAEIGKWWPESGFREVRYSATRTSVSKVAAAENAEALASPRVVVNYHLLGELRADSSWDAIVFDEAQMLGDGLTGWTLTAHELVVRNPHAAVFMLSATPAADRPEQLYSMLNVLCPGRWGKKWAFQKRYQNQVADAYAYSGYSFEGVNPVNKAELEFRLKAVMSRTSKAEARAQGWLPIAHVGMLYVQTAESGRTWQSDAAGWEGAALKAAAWSKTEEVKAWLRRDPSRALIVTYHRDVAEAMHSVCGGHGLLIDGTVQNRAEKLQRCATEGGWAVATAKSISTAVDLTGFRRVLVAELYPHPETNVQLLGRFDRLSGQEDSSVEIMVVENSHDEVKARALQNKLRDLEAMGLGGETEGALSSALTISARGTILAPDAAPSGDGYFDE